MKQNYLSIVDKLKEFLTNPQSTQNCSDQGKFIQHLRSTGYTASDISIMTKQAVNEIREDNNEFKPCIQPA